LLPSGSFFAFRYSLICRSRTLSGISRLASITGPFLLHKHTRSKGPSLHRHYPASSVPLTLSDARMTRRPFWRRSRIATPRPSRASPNYADYLSGVLFPLPPVDRIGARWLSCWRAPAPGSSRSVLPSLPAGSSFAIKYGLSLEPLAKILEWFKAVSPRPLWAIMLSSAILLFLTRVPSIANVINSALGKNKVWLLVALIGSSTMLVTYATEYGWKRIAERKRKKKIIVRLSDLTIHERKTLQNYLQCEARSYAFGREGGAADVLARDGILHLSPKTPDPMFGSVPVDLYFIDEDVWKYLHKHPELIDLEANRPSWTD
jgi:hypothetical protein